MHGASLRAETPGIRYISDKLPERPVRVQGIRERKGDVVRAAVFEILMGGISKADWIRRAVGESLEIKPFEKSGSTGTRMPHEDQIKHLA